MVEEVHTYGSNRVLATSWSAAWVVFSSTFISISHRTGTKHQAVVKLFFANHRITVQSTCGMLCFARRLPTSFAGVRESLTATGCATWRATAVNLDGLEEGMAGAA